MKIVSRFIGFHANQTGLDSIDGPVEIRQRDVVERVRKKILSLGVEVLPET